MKSHLDSQSSRLASHLTDEQFADLLLGTKSPAVRAHLDTCPTCSQEAERMSTAIGSFQQLSSAWAERRVAAAEPLRAADARRFSWSHRPLAWSAAALMIALTAGFGISRLAEHPQQGPQPVALVQPAAVVPTATLQSDNQLLSAIDGQLRADESTAAGMYGLNAPRHQEVRTKSARRLTNE
jgi:anti-sigma factor RsiW